MGVDEGGIRRMTYISQGNIPSKWAHTIQAMKMAEAFSRLVPDFRLVTQVHWTRWFLPRFDFETWYGVERRFRIVRLPSRGIPRSPLIVEHRHPLFDRAAARYAARVRSDLVFTRSPFAAKLCVEAGLPTLVEEHAPTHYSEFKWLLDVKDHPRFLGLVTISDELKRAYAEGGIRSEKIHVFPSGVDLRRFANGPTKQDARTALGLPVSGHIAMYCGHFYPHKGVDHLIQAARTLPDMTVCLVGGWPADIDRCGAATRDLPNVRFTGFVPNSDVPLHLAAADVLVLPNLKDTYDAKVTSPLKLFEYMAAGRPIVASNIPAFQSVLRHGENACLVEAGSADAIAAAIRHLQENPELAERLAAQARVDVQAYAWDTRAKAVLRAVR